MDSFHAYAVVNVFFTTAAKHTHLALGVLRTVDLVSEAHSVLVSEVSDLYSEVYTKAVDCHNTHDIHIRQVQEMLTDKVQFALLVQVQPREHIGHLLHEDRK